MLEEFDTLDEWARWKVLEVALSANEDINAMQRRGNTEIELLFPLLDTLSIAVGSSDPLVSCSCEEENTCEHSPLGGKASIILECATESGVPMCLNYAMDVSALGA